MPEMVQKITKNHKKSQKMYLIIIDRTINL